VLGKRGRKRRMKELLQRYGWRKFEGWMKAKAQG